MPPVHMTNQDNIPPNYIGLLYFINHNITSKLCKENQPCISEVNTLKYR
jgi:hypothetical protein